MKSITSKILIFLGIGCYLFTIYLVYDRTNPKRVAFDNVKIVKTIVRSRSNPKYIEIKSLDISLPIEPAVIKNGQWESTAKGISYLTSSPLPGEKGNSILYGHNWSNLLGRLPNIKTGDKIIIHFDNGSLKTFTTEYTITVTPDQTHILLPSNDNRITLYTCTGLLDSKRFVAIAVTK